MDNKSCKYGKVICIKENGGKQVFSIGKYYSVYEQAECLNDTAYKCEFRCEEISEEEYVKLAEEINKSNKEWLGWDNPVCREYWMNKG